MEEKIIIQGARVNNLKNVDLEIPRDKLVVVTGLSGSGKSSLAFDTIYAEGQRRYMETLSIYARQYVGNMERPDVDKITGLSPVVAIEQKTTGRNPRSTVGTITEINDFLRLLFARASRAYSPVTGERMVHYTDEGIADLISEGYDGRKIALLAPIVKGRKGHYRELFDSLLRKGFAHARIDGEMTELAGSMKLDRYKGHTIELVVDRLTVKPDARERLMKSLKEAMRQGKGSIMLYDYAADGVRHYSRHLMCPSTGMSFADPAPHSFSFNSPQGACPHCGGLGEESRFDVTKIVPDKKKSIRAGAIEPLGKHKNNRLFAVIEALGKRYDFTLDDPVGTIGEAGLNAVLYGDAEPVRIDAGTFRHGGGREMSSWEGVAEWLEAQRDDDSKTDKWREQFLVKEPCSACGGSRLKPEALHFRIGEHNIADLSALSIEQFAEWVKHVDELFDPRERTIAREIIKEISDRLGFLVKVGLGYLSLGRSSRSLSGGESQRIRLATQIGSRLVNVLYILDEPSIGLHQRDNRKLIASLEELRDAGNSVIVVEHDEEMIRNADFIVDVGPLGGRKGGRIIAAGSIDDVLAAPESITADYLSGRKSITTPKKRRKGNGKSIVVKGARGNNLKNVTATFPLGTMICVTGVSGSGKSTLVNDTLRPAMSRALYNSYARPLDHDAMEGLENIDKLVVVDQSPIGRSPRSNPATYSGVWSDIRKLFEQTPDAQIRGFGAGRFSFNVRGGRCEECRGAGVQTIEMNFLPDVYVRCKVCGGRRYNRETLEVKYKGKNIGDVLEMTVNMAVEFFEHIPAIHRKLKAIQSVGLGYLRLGQPCTTLSGGESQRIKLSAELARHDTGRTLYILDEPTTGLHFEDVRQLLDVIELLVDRGNTMIVIEHNLDVIKTADHIIDMGPEGGAAGGTIVAAGAPEKVAENTQSYTGRYLRPLLTKV
ncbi:MAG: excinuclease ABC subunit UvrA [Alistipes sp.]|nr:excinuclease ABC subunit UvrA [Alistipes sp.]